MLLFLEYCLTAQVQNSGFWVWGSSNWQKREVKPLCEVSSAIALGIKRWNRRWWLVHFPGILKPFLTNCSDTDKLNSRSATGFLWKFLDLPVEVYSRWNYKPIYFAKFILAKGTCGCYSFFSSFFAALELCWAGVLQCMAPEDSTHSLCQVHPLELSSAQPAQLLMEVLVLLLLEPGVTRSLELLQILWNACWCYGWTWAFNWTRFCTPNTQMTLYLTMCLQYLVAVTQTLTVITYVIMTCLITVRHLFGDWFKGFLTLVC